MSKWMIPLAAIACSGLGATPALACATVSFSPTTPSLPTWNPINGAQVQATFTATIARTSSSSRSARLIFVDANNSTAPVRVGSAGPIYVVTNLDSNATVSFPLGTAVIGQTVATTDLPNGNSGNSVPVNMRVAIPVNTAVEDFTGGTSFSETINYAVQCFNNAGNNDGSIGPLAAVTLSMTIPKLVSLITASPQTINFGNFTTATQQLQIGLKSTSTVNVAVSTTNAAVMVLNGAVAPYPANSSIPYSMSINGAAISSGGSLTNQTRAGVAGTSWPLLLTLTGGIPSGKLAGTYQDIITLTLSAGL